MGIVTVPRYAEVPNIMQRAQARIVESADAHSVPQLKELEGDKLKPTTKEGRMVEPVDECAAQ